MKTIHKLLCTLALATLMTGPAHNALADPNAMPLKIPCYVGPNGKNTCDASGNQIPKPTDISGYICGPDRTLYTYDAAGKLTASKTHECIGVAVWNNTGGTPTVTPIPAIVLGPAKANGIGAKLNGNIIPGTNIKAPAGSINSPNLGYCPGGIPVAPGVPCITSHFNNMSITPNATINNVDMKKAQEAMTQYIKSKK